ncbi:MAG: hypothetical protein MSH32_05795 [Lachnospiraceae bacterium]|nr:hypothetical protein [Lachnospiraceae bacterium]
MDKNDLSKLIFGRSSVEKLSEKKNETNMASGIAASDSSDGYVIVNMGGESITYDNSQSIKIKTTVSVKEGDTVSILLSGAKGSARTPIVIGVVGRGDEQQKSIDEAENTAQAASQNADSAKEAANKASDLANSANANANEAKELASNANTASGQANEKAAQAETNAADALKAANAAQTKVDDVGKDISSLQGNVDAMNEDISNTKKKAEENASAIVGINQNLSANYATKTEVSDTKAAIESEISSSAESIKASVKETYASKNDVTQIQGELENKIQVNADGISTTSKKVESIESDTQDISEKLNSASKAASDAQAQANTAVSNAKAAQDTADKAVSDAKAADDKAKTAQGQLDEAKQKVADADAALKTAKQSYDSALSNYTTITSSGTATEEQVKEAESNLETTQTALNEALANMLTANHNVTEAQTAASDALKNATTAYSNAAKALTNAKAAQETADKAVADAEKANKDLAELTNRVTTTETAIEQNNESITSLAKRTDTVENKFAGYYTKTETDSQINQKAESITSTVSQTYQTKADAANNLSSAKSYADSRVEQTAEGINSTVSKKVGKDEVISSINQSAEDVAINANKININGTVSANGNFKVDTAGNLTAKSASLQDCTISGTLDAGTKFSDGSSVKDSIASARSKADSSYAVAVGKNKVIYSTGSDPPSTSGYVSGDIWFNQSTGGIWQFNGSSWQQHQVGNTSIKKGAITSDKMTVGSLSAISANLGTVTAGVIKSSDDGSSFLMDATNKKLKWSMTNSSMDEDGTITTKSTDGRGATTITRLASGEVSSGLIYMKTRNGFSASGSTYTSYYGNTANDSNIKDILTVMPGSITDNWSQDGESKDWLSLTMDSFKYNGHFVPVIMYGTAAANSGTTSCYLTKDSVLTTNNTMPTYGRVVMAMMISGNNENHIEGVQNMNGNYYALFNGALKNNATIRWVAIGYYW